MGWCGHICVIDRWSRLKKRKRRTFIEFRNGFYTHADRMFKGGACTYSYCEMPMPHLLKMARRVFRPSPSLCSHQRCGIYVHKPVYLFKIVPQLCSQLVLFWLQNISIPIPGQWPENTDGVFIYGWLLSGQTSFCGRKNSREFHEHVSGWDTRWASTSYSMEIYPLYKQGHNPRYPVFLRPYIEPLEP